MKCYVICSCSDELPPPPPPPPETIYMPLTGGGLTVFSREPMTNQEMIDALIHAPDSTVCHVPPVKPCAGETYLVECPTFQDWACDQYQWVHKGKSLTKTSNGIEILKHHYHIRVPGYKEGKGRSRPNASNKFRRVAIFLASNPKRVMVTYQGDEKMYVPLPHGNSKNSTEYVRTAKSLLKEMKSTQAKPMTVYRKLSSNPNISGEHHVVLNPRNPQQVRNHQRLTRDKGKLSKDDIYNLVQLAHHLDGFVEEITIYPDLISIFALPEMIDTFVELIQSNADSPVCLVYDTTFNLGDFYVSPLVFRHVLFESTPWMPLPFLVHDRKLQKSHNRLFEYLSDRIPVLKGKRIPFITHRRGN